ncbi:Flagellum-specific ATP synthase FliI [Shigella boydii ATCC 9905]|nr:Flagellum-specific ATP synthase FliI [Shigella boydii ATCC 9905]
MLCKQTVTIAQMIKGHSLASARMPKSDPMLDKAIALWPQLEGYLQQGIFERADWEASLQGLERIFPTVS